MNASATLTAPSAETSTRGAASAVLHSPIGDLLLVAGPDGALTDVHLPGRHPTDAPPRDEALLAPAAEQLAAYFAGDLQEFDLPLRPSGGPFELRVWEELARIPYGETWSYGELAARIGSPGAARAVGRANGRNPLAIVLPCHRVIGSNGALTGYAGGLDRKRALLAAEAGRTWTLLGPDRRPYESRWPGTLGGHRRNRVYGRLDCAGAQRWIAKGHYVSQRVFFADEDAAVAAGFRPCAGCLPQEYAAWKAAAAVVTGSTACRASTTSSAFRSSSAPRQSIVSSG